MQNIGFDLYFFFLNAFDKAEVQDASTDQMPQRDLLRNEAYDTSFIFILNVLAYTF